MNPSTEPKVLEEGRVSWSSPSNIAIVKYWGKRGEQLPQNASLSLTLSASQTQMRVSYAPKGPKESPGLRSFLFQGLEKERFKARIQNYLHGLKDRLGFLDRVCLDIESENTFPHSCGVASSASAFSALALCLCEIQEELMGASLPREDFFRKASCLARLGSGSACRSLYAPLALWGNVGQGPFVDDHALPFREIHPDFLGLRDDICIVDGGVKPVSSSLGHELMEGNPWAKIRYATANRRVRQLMDILKSGEVWDFMELACAEGMALHGLMWVSPRPSLLLKPASLAIMEKVIECRRRHKIPLGFTVDAGPNVHVLSLDRDRKTVAAFLKEELAPLCERIIEDRLGEGPRRTAGEGQGGGRG
ncbi:MAG: hypothetical protein OXB88_05680 [Bacteriovoracales bacterium]|nr:hypothetical protein [Bacteriovoracales bacterium]